MKKIDSLPQDKLALQLRNAIDEARFADPIRGVPRAARQRVRRLIEENPRSVRSVHVQHNVGKQRWAWLQPLLEEA